jgi:hypothetical protein
LKQRAHKRIGDARLDSPPQRPGNEFHEHRFLFERAHLEHLEATQPLVQLARAVVAHERASANIPAV